MATFVSAGSPHRLVSRGFLTQQPLSAIISANSRIHQGTAFLLPYFHRHRRKYHNQCNYQAKTQPIVPSKIQPPSTLFGTLSSSSSSSSSSSMTLELPTAQDTEEVAAVVASILLEPYFNTHPVTTTMASSRLQNLKGTICLDGDLGAGKTAFARGFLRAATGDEELRVTSPTYLLVNVYPILGGSLEIHHMDLYRLSGDPKDLLPLNLEHVFENCVSLIEWPERLGSTPIPEDRLDINIKIGSGIDTDADDGDNEGEDDALRIMTIQAHGPVWEDRLETILEEGYLDDLLL